MKAASPTRLAGHLLIAMPSLTDPNFSRTVTLICEHNEFGALGVTINRPLDMSVGEVFEQLHITASDPRVATVPVFHGGPVHAERGFVLHEATRVFASTLRVSDDLAVSTSRDVLEALAATPWPDRTLVALGCAGWGPGQLEAELAENTWLNVPATPAIVFDLPAADRWDAAARLLGIDLRLLSGDAGHA